jgi:hypothetical protein
MTTAPLAKAYAHLTAAERLPLVVAASARGDDVEYHRLMASAPLETYHVPHHFGRAMAFREVADMHHMELLALAGQYLQCMGLADAQDDEHSTRFLDCGLLYGYLLNAHVAGWRAFCAGLHIDPEPIRDCLPGRDLLDQVAGLAGSAAFDADGARAYLRRKFKADPDTLLTADRVAGGLRATFQARAEWWG